MTGVPRTMMMMTIITSFVFLLVIIIVIRICFISKVVRPQLLTLIQIFKVYMQEVIRYIRFYLQKQRAVSQDMDINAVYTVM